LWQIFDRISDETVASSFMVFYLFIYFFFTLKKAAADTHEVGTSLPRYTPSERTDDGELPVYDGFLVPKAKVKFSVCRKNI